MKEFNIDNHKIIIRGEQPSDFRKVEEMTRDSFWNVYRPGCTEHYVLHCFRNSPDFVPELDYVMEMDGEIIGQIIFVHAHVDTDDGKKLPVMTFGPVCIANKYKRKGYGKILLDYATEQAKELGVGALLTEGNLLFYGKCGFVPAKNFGVRYADDPEADYFIAKELQSGFFDGVSGTYSDPKGYFVAVNNPQDFEEYDKTFPCKEKLVLPGQLC